ncbi:tetratricopeptide repeat-containing sensor histidine kinase [Xanthovirga aplysinae]|uniref:tetratricopeptide repeat-containing sensor histidine kinase n=1 Tax=Xanthovirga aplysinae TaxID=2529853 RepID=UPI0012BBC09D|nr:tetratricopeptide repeat protein [Xanthovirga aplysinae]MTI31701.1 tetratricopeptide repeat protein [Xanthovirga aplysinae]
MIPGKIKKIFTLLFLILGQSTFLGIYAQEMKPRDELKKAEVESYNKLSKNYIRIDLHKSLEFSKKALNIAEEIQWPKGIATSLSNQGRYYREIGDYRRATAPLLKALKISNEIKDQKLAVIILGDLGLSFTHLKDKEFEALDYLEQALQISQKIGFIPGECRTLSFIGRYYYQKKEYEKSIDFYQKAIEKLPYVETTRGTATLMENMGLSYRKMEHPLKARQYFLDAYNILKTTDNIRVISELLKHIGDTYQDSGDNNLALDYYKKALDYSIKSSWEEQSVELYQTIANMYAAENNYEQAFTYGKLQANYKDSLYRENLADQFEILQKLTSTEKQLSRMEKDLLSQKNKVQKAELEKRRILSYFLIVSLSLITFVFIGLYIRFTEKKRSHALLEIKNQRISTQNKMLNDINEKLKQSEQELKTLNSTKDTLFSIISHDLRSPINTLSSFLKLFTNSPNHFSEKELKLVSEKMKQSLHNLSQMLDGLLNWSLSQMGKINYSPEKLSIKELTHEVLAPMEDSIENKELTLNLKFQTDQWAYADPNMLRIVIRNILANAIKFTPRGGNIQISTHFKNPFIELIIEDSGIGMSREEIEKLLKGYEHLSNPGTEKEKGTGLGLKLSKDFIDENKGELKISSELGKGSTITICIPALKPSEKLEMKS